jgi:hypothetical protein
MDILGGQYGIALALTINRKSSELLDRLEQNGILIHFFDPTMGLMYHKFCIIDDKMLIIGSYIWTFHLSCRLKSFHAEYKKLFCQSWGSIAKANEIFPGPGKSTAAGRYECRKE